MAEHELSNRTARPPRRWPTPQPSGCGSAEDDVRDGARVASGTSPAGGRGVTAFLGRLRGRRGSWLLARLAWGVLTAWAVTVLIFLATHALPGDPARAVLGHTATQARVDQLREQLGLDRPLVSQYLSWAGNAVRGDFGNSLVGGRTSVWDTVSSPLSSTLTLVLVTAAISVPLAVAFGAYAGSRRDRALDHTVSGMSLVLTAVPEFVIGLVLVILLSTSVLHILPAVTLFRPGVSPLTSPRHLVLPVATLTLAAFPYLARLVRGSVIEAYEADYVRMARFKGAPESAVLRRHVLPNALVPAIQGTTLTLAYLMGGIVVVEYLFNYPGLGTSLSEAISNRDYPTIQAITLFFALAYIVFNIIGDVLTVYVSPRLRTAGA